MTSRTWIGGGNNNANNANDWSPAGAPLLGDVLAMQTGVMHIRDNNLAGNTLVIGGSASTTLNSIPPRACVGRNRARLD